jgi:dTDP-4-dehydrorhamnose 3,5-epimerase
MRYDALSIPGPVLMTPEPIPDARGFFARLLDFDEMREHGLECDFVQESLAYNERAGTIRGMHYQREPHAETKIVRCVRGAVYDVVIDVRPDSPAFGKWVALRLDGESRRALYVPPGFAHGYQTLEDGTELHYHITPKYEPSGATGIHYADATLAIPWPIREGVTISERDLALPVWSKP